MPARRRAAPSRRLRALLRAAARRSDLRLPLFTPDGQLVSARMISECVARGWAEPWFAPAGAEDWTVCRLTEAGRAACA